MAALSMIRLNQGYGFLCISTVSHNVPGRNISKRKLLNQLNLPVQPKRPPTPFVLFFQEIKDKLKSQEPGSDGENLVKRTALLWKELSPEKKKMYQNNYQALRDKYSKELEKFEEELTPQQKTQLESFGVHYQNVKEIQATETLRRSKEKEFNKPKHPVPPYAKFVLDLQLDVNLKEAWKLGKEKWNQLPEIAKEKYRSQFKQELKQYKKDLEAWEQEMIEKGHTDIVRQKTLKVKMLSNDV